MCCKGYLSALLVLLFIGSCEALHTQSTKNRLNPGVGLNSDNYEFRHFQMFLRWMDQAEHFAEYLEHRSQFLSWKQNHQSGIQSIEKQGYPDLVDRHRNVQHQSTDPHEWEQVSHMMPHMVRASEQYINDVESTRMVENETWKHIHQEKSVGQPIKESASNVISSVSSGAAINFAEEDSKVTNFPQYHENFSFIQDSAQNVYPSVDEAFNKKEQEFESMTSLSASIATSVLGRLIEMIWKSDKLMVIILVGAFIKCVKYYLHGFTNLVHEMLWCFANAFQMLFFFFCGREAEIDDTEVRLACNLEDLFETGQEIEDEGIAKPATLMLCTISDELTKGQQYILFKIIGVDRGKWDSAVQERKESPDSSFSESLGLSWDQFAKFHQTFLKKIGLSREIWSCETAEALHIKDKHWDLLNTLEKTKAENRLKLDKESWNQRSAPLFKQQWNSLGHAERKWLKKIGFRRVDWQCYCDAKVPKGTVSEYVSLRPMMELVHLCGVWMWIFFQVLWVLAICVKVGAIQPRHVVWILAIGFAICYLYETANAAYTYLHETVMPQLRSISLHVVDLWINFHEVVHAHVEKCKECAKKRCENCSEGCFSFACSRCMPCGLPHVQQPPPQRAQSLQRQRSILGASSHRVRKRFDFPYMPSEEAAAPRPLKRGLSTFRRSLGSLTDANSQASAQQLLTPEEKAV